MVYSQTSKQVLHEDKKKKRNKRISERQDTCWYEDKQQNICSHEDKKQDTYCYENKRQIGMKTKRAANRVRIRLQTFSAN